MDFDFIQRFAPMYVKAAGLTLRIGLIGIALSLVIGALCCLARYFRVPVLRQIVSAYIELARNTPLLVQLFFLYFGLPKVGVKLSAEACAVTGLTFLGGAYMAEALRSGLEAVDRAQAGRCFFTQNRVSTSFAFNPPKGLIPWTWTSSGASRPCT